MKKEIKGFVLGVVTTVVVGSGVGFAASQLTSIDVYPNNVSIAANGQYVDTSSFTYNDRTFVQLRPVLEQMDCYVDYVNVNGNNVVSAANKFRKDGEIVLLNNGIHFSSISEGDPSTLQSDLESYVNTDILFALGLSYEGVTYDERQTPLYMFRY